MTAKQIYTRYIDAFDCLDLANVYVRTAHGVFLEIILVPNSPIVLFHHKVIHMGKTSATKPGHTLCMLKTFQKTSIYIYISIISRQRDGTSGLHRFSWKTHLSWIINSVAANAQETQEARDQYTGYWPSSPRIFRFYRQGPLLQAQTG